MANTGGARRHQMSSVQTANHEKLSTMGGDDRTDNSFN